MTLSYADATALAFGSRTFSVAEFGNRLNCLRPHRRLSELKTRGLVERVARGRYRLLSPDERPDLRGVEAARVHRLLLASGLPMAWSGSTAVHLWTGGRYAVSPSVFLREFIAEIPVHDLGRWTRFLRARRINSDPRRRLGVRVELRPVKRLRFVNHRGEPVIPRRAAIDMVRSHPGVYAGAEELIER